MDIIITQIFEFMDNHPFWGVLFCLVGVIPMVTLVMDFILKLLELIADTFISLIHGRREPVSPLESYQKVKELKEQIDDDVSNGNYPNL